MTIEADIRAAASQAVAPLEENIRTILATVQRIEAQQARLAADVAALKAHMPMRGGSVKQAAAELGCSELLIRRQIKRGAIAARKVGGKVVVDLASLRPATPEEIAKLARQAMAAPTRSRSSRP